MFFKEPLTECFFYGIAVKSLLSAFIFQSEILFIKESWGKKYITFPQKYEAAQMLSTININQKCFLSSKSVYENDFWRSCDTEDCINDAENKLHFTIYSNRNQVF